MDLVVLNRSLTEGVDVWRFRIGLERVNESFRVPPLNP